MKRALAAVVLLAACKGAGKKAIDAAPAAQAKPDATPAGFQCTEVGARMATLFTEQGGTLNPRDVEVLFTQACIDDGWSEAASKCAIAIPAGEGADACLAQLAPYPMVALAARLRQIGALPFQDPATVTATDCEAATTVLGLAWALDAAKVAAPGTSARPYTELFQGLSNELGEMCTDQKWDDGPRTCLARTRVPQQLDQLHECVDGLPDATKTQLEQLRKQVVPAMLGATEAGTATGGDDCTSVGQAMTRVWTIKAERSMAKHPAEAQWDLDHLEDLRALVVAACTEDAWPHDVRTCLTALKLPDEAPKFQACIEALPAPASEALGKRTAVLEALRDQATGGTP